MSTLFSRGDKLYAKRDKINVFAIPDGGGTPFSWPYRPMRSAPGQGFRDYKRFDELGPFYDEVEIEGIAYLEITSWENRAPDIGIGNPYTVVRHVYVKKSEDSVLTESQKQDDELQLANEKKLAELKSTVYPQWAAKGIKLPSNVYFEKDESENSVLYLEFTGPPFNKIAYDSFSGLDLPAKLTASGVKPDTGSSDPPPDPDTTNEKDNTVLYAVLALVGVMVLGMAFLFIKKRRSA